MRSRIFRSLTRTKTPADRPVEAPLPSTGRRWWVVAVMCAGMFLVLLDVTVINVALPMIGTGLHASLPELQWIVTAYTVTFAALLLAGGALGDSLGHKRLVVAGLVIFGVASAGCGVSPTAGWLVLARAVQGVGAAALLSATLAVITACFPERTEQAKALGVWAGISSLALPAGPIVGGLLVTGGGWRAVFWINVPLVALALILTLWLVPRSRSRRERRIDIPGIVERVTGDALLPLGLLKSATFVGANTIAGAMNFVGIGTIFIVTLYLQDVRHYSALLGGLSLLPLFIPLAILSPVTGRLTARYGPRMPMSLGLALGAGGSLFLIVLAPSSGYVKLLPALLGLGLGMGFLTAAVVSAAMRSVLPDRAGLASGVNNAARQAGGALGIAVYGAMAGNPAHAATFVSGIHTLAVIGSVVWAIALLITLTIFRNARAA